MQVCPHNMIRRVTIFRKGGVDTFRGRSRDVVGKANPRSYLDFIVIVCPTSIIPNPPISFHDSRKFVDLRPLLSDPVILE